MAEKDGEKSTDLSNVKHSEKSAKFERFGENFRYFTLQEWHKFLDSIDNYKHKLMMLLIYELGCRVGEFVKIKLKHIDLGNCSIFFPAENTKTKQKRTSNIPVGLMNDLKEYLKQNKRMLKREDKIKEPEEYLFSSNDSRTPAITENRIRQIFRKYIIKSGLDREYGTDSLGRKLHKFSVHSLRHSHIMHHIHIYKIPVPVVQRQVGHKTLNATMVYCRPTDEMVKEEYEKARKSESSYHIINRET